MAAEVDLRQIDLRRPICPQIGVCALCNPRQQSINKAHREMFVVRWFGILQRRPFINMAADVDLGQIDLQKPHLFLR
jgi:hypothetical protein